MSAEKRYSVLVVDDSTHVVEFVAELLRREGHAVVSARSGREAATILDSIAVDVVITDVLMPDGDGIELLNHVRRDSRHPPRMIAISGGGRYVDSRNCLALATASGAHACLKKPFTDVELLAALEAS